jgi:hypothetical protein
VTDASPRRLRRGVVVTLVVIVALVVVGGAFLIVRARQVDRSVEALCEELVEAQDLDQSLTTLDPTTLDPQVSALRRAARVAPSDIEPSIVVVADFVGELADAVDSAEGDRDDALTLALEVRQDRVSGVTEAGTAVQTWAEANCGLTLVGPSTTTTAAVDDTTGAPPGTTP